MDKLDKSLIKIFEEAQLQIDSIFLDALRAGDYAKSKVMLSKIKAISEELKTKYSIWLYNRSYSSYIEGYNIASDTLGKDKIGSVSIIDYSDSKRSIIELQNTSMDMSVLHRESIIAMIDNSSGAVYTTIDGISKNINITMAKVVQQQIRKSIAIGMVVGRGTEEQKQGLLDIFGKNKSVGMFKDSLGRTWDAKTYAENLVRTETSRAYNLGTVNRGLELGHRAFQVIEKSNCCDLCATHNGKIYIITNQGYIELPPYHNNCQGIVVIYLG